MNRIIIITLGIFLMLTAPLRAQVFEVIHPEAEKGEIEVEVLAGVSLTDTEAGDEIAAEEFAIGYGITDFWKLTLASEVVSEDEGDTFLEALEVENVFLLKPIQSCVQWPLQRWRGL